jgi:adenylylsulfate kinase
VEHKFPAAFAVWMTGLPASGKSTVTRALIRRLRDLDINPAVLESDSLRKMFSVQPGYDEQDREYFYGSLAFIGSVLTQFGVPVVFDATANLRSYRNRARQLIPWFIEVFVDAPLETCIRRDPKGIYEKAMSGEAGHVPGVGARYEPPEKPEVVVRGDIEDPDVAAARLIDELEKRSFLKI